jgi:GNAT superfamily N-acetyltransferase
MPPRIVAKMEIRLIRPDDDVIEAGLVVQRAYMELPGYPGDADYDELLARVDQRMHQVPVVIAIERVERNTEAGSGVTSTQSVGDTHRIVGCLTFVPESSHHYFEFDERPPHASSMRFFAMAPEARGKGVGRAMVQWVIDESRRLGKDQIQFHTLDCMPAAQRLYETMGFERAPHLDGDWDGITGLAYHRKL